jgi:hypothetical protein
LIGSEAPLHRQCNFRNAGDALTEPVRAVPFSEEGQVQSLHSSSKEKEFASQLVTRISP